jgi:hypothetical protein
MTGTPPVSRISEVRAAIGEGDTELQRLTAASREAYRRYRDADAALEAKAAELRVLRRELRGLTTETEDQA